jgi:hypothetical protein
VMLMIAGAALFSTFTAFVATYFIQSTPAENDRIEALVQEVRALREELERHGITRSPDADRRVGA